MNSGEKTATIITAILTLGCVVTFGIMSQCSQHVADTNVQACIQQHGQWAASTDPAEAGGSCTVAPSGEVRK
jgi:hypothetical protein